MPRGDLAGVAIRLERSACFGTCPIYTVELHGDGRGVYDGGCYTLASGRHAFVVSPQAVADLVERFRAADFWSLAPSYTALITDNPAYDLSLTIGGQTKRVQDYVGHMVGMPKAVTELELAIDEVAGSSRWVVGDARTIATLQAEGFDFASPTAGRILAGAAGGMTEDLALQLLAKGAPTTAPSDAATCGSLGDAAGEGVATRAASRRHLILLRALIHAGALNARPARDRALFGAVASQSAEVVREVLAAGADPNGLYGPSTPLIWMAVGPHPFASDKAARTDDAEITRLLIAAGADPNARDNNGDTALHHTFDPQVARALISGGARIEARDNAGKTPLFTTYSEDVALVLLDAGARTDAAPIGASFEAWVKGRNWQRVRTRAGL